jgi:Arc/MetJ family transcription regulator
MVSVLRSYTPIMTTAEKPAGKHKTTIDIDLELLARAQEVLGTKGIKDTIDKALHEVWRTGMRMRFLRRLETQEGIDIGPEMLEQTRASWKKWAE